MKMWLLLIGFIMLTGCSTEILVYNNQKNINQDEGDQMLCYGGYLRLNGKFQPPDLDKLSPEHRKLYEDCLVKLKQTRVKY